MKNKAKWLIYKAADFFLSRVENHYDMQICGRRLSEYIPSMYRDDKNGVGMTGTAATRYPELKKIFSNVEIKETDVLLDVGCGMGRVLAFCVKQKYPCALYGIEINEKPYRIAESWAGRYGNVHVMHGDAFKLDYNQYTILFLNRPFLPKTFTEFIHLIESQLTHPIQFIYFVDQQSGRYLVDRKGWTLKKRDIIRVLGDAQGYSIWEYTPQDETTGKEG